MHTPTNINKSLHNFGLEKKEAELEFKNKNKNAFMQCIVMWN